MSRKVLEIRSKTVEEAVGEGLDRLQLKREDVAVRVLEEPARVLGFSSDAVVWLVYDSPEEQSVPLPGEDIADEEIETIDELVTETDEAGQDTIVEEEEVPPAGPADVEESQPAAESSVTDASDTAEETVEDGREGEVGEQSVEAPSDEIAAEPEPEEVSADEPLKLDFSEQGIFVDIARDDDSEPVSAVVVRDFLEANSVFGVSDDVLAKIVDSSEKRFNLITPEIISVGTGKVGILKKEDLTAASLIVYDKGDLTADAVKSALNENSVVKGIDEEAVTTLLSDSGDTKCVVVARGLAPVARQYGELKFQVPSEEVDWQSSTGEGRSRLEVLRIGVVEEGQLITAREIENEGSEGYAIDGTEIRPDVIEPDPLRAGKNVEASDDGLTAKSLVSGHFVYCAGVLRVEENVKVLDIVNEDAAEGEVEPEGLVFVRGNVEAKGMIRAGGDVIIAGVLNNGTVESRGDVVVGMGISNDEGGYVRAAGLLNTKSILRSKVEARAVVATKEIVESNVTAVETIEAVGEPGVIVGGKLSAGSIIRANIIGDDSGTLTELAVQNPDEVDSAMKESGSVVADKALHAQVDITIGKANDKTAKEMSGTIVTQSEGRLKFSELN